MTEKELEDFLFNDLSTNKGQLLSSRGFPSFDDEYFKDREWYRQLNIDPYGICDVVSIKKSDVDIENHPGAKKVDVTIFELKATHLKCNDFDQVLRYKTGLEHFIEIPQTIDYGYVLWEVKCFLIGSGFNSGHFICHQFSHDLSVITYSTGVTGISFEKYISDYSETERNLLGIL